MLTGILEKPFRIVIAGAVLFIGMVLVLRDESDTTLALGVCIAAIFVSFGLMLCVGKYGHDSTRRQAALTTPLMFLMVLFANLATEVDSTYWLGAGVCLVGSVGAFAIVAKQSSAETSRLPRRR